LGWSITSSHGNQLGGDVELAERRRVRIMLKSSKVSQNRAISNTRLEVYIKSRINGHFSITIKPMKPKISKDSKFKMESSATREYPSLIHTFFLTHTIGGIFLNPEDKALYLKSQPEYGGGSESGGCEPRDDEDGGEDEEDERMPIGSHMSFQCQPMNEDCHHEQNSCYNSNSFGFDQFLPQQLPVIDQTPLEESMKNLRIAFQAWSENIQQKKEEEE
nr:hypothetical protein [Tanacetum cinerariifolium]